MEDLFRDNEKESDAGSREDIAGEIQRLEAERGGTGFSGAANSFVGRPQTSLVSGSARGLDHAKGFEEAIRMGEECWDFGKQLGLIAQVGDEQMIRVLGGIGEDVVGLEKGGSNFR